MDGNDLVTLIIPTNRSAVLRRALDYYSQCQAKFNILVADSGSDESKAVNMQTVSSFNDLNVFHIGDYSPKIVMFQKITLALEQVKTKYSVICGDDDFIVPDGINKSVDFLEDNPDYTVAHGYYISHRLDELKQQRFVWTLNQVCPSVTSPDAAERFRIHFINYYPTFYGVHKTDSLKMILEETSKYTDEGRFGELLPSMLSAIHGKLKRLDLLYGMREYSQASTGRIFKSIPQLIKEGDFDCKYVRFRSCLVSHFLTNSNMPEDQLAKIIDETIHIYMQIGKWRFTHIEKLKELSIYDKLFLPTVELRERLRSCLEDPSSKYYNDFVKLKKHVLHYGYIEY